MLLMYSNPTRVMLDYNTHKKWPHRNNTLSLSFSDVTACSSSTADGGFKFANMTTSSRHAQDRYVTARAAGAVTTAAWWMRMIIPAQPRVRFTSLLQLR
jgi:hypothetical protein